MVPSISLGLPASRVYMCAHTLGLPAACVYMCAHTLGLPVAHMYMCVLTAAPVYTCAHTLAGMDSLAQQLDITGKREARLHISLWPWCGAFS